MADINGTNGPDDIDVTDDVGDLNGTTIGGPGDPIDSVEALQGNDTISVDNSTISGRVRGNGGNDDITVTDSTIGGNLAGNGGADTISVTDSTITARLNGGGGDDTVTVVGSSVDRINLGNQDDSLDFVNSSSSEGLFGGGGTDALNLPVGTVINDAGSPDPIVVELGVSYTLTNGSFTLPTGQVIDYSQFESGTGIPCFTAGTRILTERGERLVENIQPGDRVLTMDCGLQPVRWVGTRKLSQRELRHRQELRPICIRKGVLGEGYPAQDLIVSPQHRVLLRSRIAQRMFGEFEILVPAVKLKDLSGVSQVENCEGVEYIHLMFDTHQIVFSNGQPSESLYAGREALKSLSPAAYIELVALFPELQNAEHRPLQARTFVKKSAQISNLIARHKKNNQPLLSNGRN